MHVTVNDLKTRFEQGAQIQVVDVRSASEYAGGHIPGAVNIPMDQIESRLDDLSSRTPVVLACRSGQRASMTCSLIEHRHPQVFVLEGGTEAWKANGLPIVASRRTRWSIERQVRLTAGLLVLIGVILHLTVDPWWLALSAFIGAGLTFAGLTDLCGMAYIYSLMPWNKPRQGAAVGTGNGCAQA